MRTNRWNGAQTAIPYSRTRTLPKNSPEPRTKNTTATYMGFRTYRNNPLTTKWRVGKTVQVYRDLGARRGRTNSKGWGALPQSTTPQRIEEVSSQQRRSNLPSTNPPRHVTGNDSRRNDKEYRRAKNGGYSPHARNSICPLAVGPPLGNGGFG